ncbi:MAG: iron-sulfur cluster assembly accessory protein [Thermodesulfovibrio sp.]
MFTISEKAAEKAKQILKNEGKEGWGLRIFSAEGYCSPSFGLDIDEKPQEGDEVLEKNGLKVYIDKQTFNLLRELELDYYEDEEQEGFILKGQMPSCGPGCGGSCEV